MLKSNYVHIVTYVRIHIHTLPSAKQVWLTDCCYWGGGWESERATKSIKIIPTREQARERESIIKSTHTRRVACRVVIARAVRHKRTRNRVCRSFFTYIHTDICTYIHKFVRMLPPYIHINLDIHTCMYIFYYIHNVYINICTYMYGELWHSKSNKSIYVMMYVLTNMHRYVLYVFM